MPYSVLLVSSELLYGVIDLPKARGTAVVVLRVRTREHNVLSTALVPRNPPAVVGEGQSMT